MSIQKDLERLNYGTVILYHPFQLTEAVEGKLSQVKFDGQLWRVGNLTFWTAQVNYINRNHIVLKVDARIGRL